MKLIPTFAYIIEITKNAKEGTLRIITNIEQNLISFYNNIGNNIKIKDYLRLTLIYTKLLYLKEETIRVNLKDQEHVASFRGYTAT